MIMHEWNIDRCRYVVYTWENGLLFYLCVCVRERGASATQQPSLSIRPSLARSHVTHASTCTFWHPHPAPAHLKARTISSWIPCLACSFLSHTHTFLSLGLFSLNIWHTHTQHTAHTHPLPRAHNSSPSKVIWWPLSLVLLRTPACTTPQSSKRASRRSKTATTLR